MEQEEMTLPLVEAVVEEKEIVGSFRYCNTVRRGRGASLTSERHCRCDACDPARQAPLMPPAPRPCHSTRCASS